MPMLPIMFLIFMTLKLTGQIDWSWWLVTAPLWGGFAFVFALAFLAAIADAFTNTRRGRR